MLKRLVKKRIAQFKKDYPEYKESKKGSFYYSHNEQKVEKGMTFNVFNVTKGTLDKLGTSKMWANTKSEYVVLITSTGKLMVKNRFKQNFKLVTMKDVRMIPTLLKTYLVGRKFEYLQDYPNLMEYNFFQGFNSLREAKIFLGYGFISDDDFYSLFTSNPRYSWNADRLSFKYIIQTPDENKSNMVALLKSTRDRNDTFQILEDYHSLAEQTQQPKLIPRSMNKLRELHDKVTDIFNERKAEQYSAEVDCAIMSVRSDHTTFEDDWKERGISFIKLDNPRALYLEGVKQKHCIGRYTQELNRNSFYRIIHNESYYNIQIDTNGLIKQFKGYRNCNPPEELLNLISDTHIDYRHDISFKGSKMVSSFVTTHGTFVQNLNTAIDTYSTLQSSAIATPNVEFVSARQYASLLGYDQNTIYIIRDDNNDIRQISRGGTLESVDDFPF